MLLFLSENDFTIPKWGYIFNSSSDPRLAAYTGAQGAA
jgi:hypothetical protein